MEPEEKSWDRALEELRPILLLVARQSVNPRLWKDVDPSGVVQETLVEALKGRPQFKGSGLPSLECWLRKILLHNLYDALRRIHRERRDVNRVVPIDQAVEDSTQRLQSQLTGQDASPSEIAMRKEDLFSLASALERLDEAQRSVVEIRHLQGRSLAEAAAILGRSESAVAALLHRGLKRLKEEMKKG
jgi:RNA polymerase sigma-70 factor (ECF subfamily)